MYLYIVLPTLCRAYLQWNLPTTHVWLSQDESLGKHSFLCDIPHLCYQYQKSAAAQFCVYLDSNFIHREFKDHLITQALNFIEVICNITLYVHSLNLISVSLAMNQPQTAPGFKEDSHASASSGMVVTVYSCLLLLLSLSLTSVFYPAPLGLTTPGHASLPFVLLA